MSYRDDSHALFARLEAALAENARLARRNAELSRELATVAMRPRVDPPTEVTCAVCGRSTTIHAATCPWCGAQLRGTGPFTTTLRMFAVGPRYITSPRPPPPSTGRGSGWKVGALGVVIAAATLGVFLTVKLLLL